MARRLLLSGCMELHEAIYRRRAVRAYYPKAVDEVLLRSLLKAAVQAPSAMNRQPWRFAVVQNTQTLRRYSDEAKRLLLQRLRTDQKSAHYAQLLGSEAFNIFYDASTLVAIGVDEPNDYSAADCWLAAQNLMLAATAASLGTCPIGFAVGVLNTAEVKRELGFAPGGQLYAPIIVGYPTESQPPVPREPPAVSVWLR